jgi:hypothetical protein
MSVRKLFKLQLRTLPSEEPRVDIARKLKAFVRKNKTGLIREGRFALIVVLWVAFYVGIMRHRWTQIEEREIVRNFNQSTTESFAQFEDRNQFWELQAKKIAAFTTDQPPSTVRIQQDSWTAIYDSHPEWLATHLIARRDNFEPTVTVALTSKQVRRCLLYTSDAADETWPV